MVGTVVILAGCSSGRCLEPARGRSRARRRRRPASPAASASASAAASPERRGDQGDPGPERQDDVAAQVPGILPFDQSEQGAQERGPSSKNPEKLAFVGPTAENSVAGQIEFMTNAPTQGMQGRSCSPTTPATRSHLRPKRPQKAGTQGRDLGLADPLGPGRDRLRGAGRLRRDRRRHGGHGTVTRLGLTAASSPSSPASPDAANQNAWIEAPKKAAGGGPEVRKASSWSTPSTATMCPR